MPPLGVHHCASMRAFSAAVRPRGARTVHETSGLQVCLGGADDDVAGLEQQVTEATNFLEDEAAEIRRLRSLPGVQVARLRFGAFWPVDTGAKLSSFPSSLLLLCGELGLDIVLCEYWGARSA